METDQSHAPMLPRTLLALAIASRSTTMSVRSATTRCLPLQSCMKSSYEERCIDREERMDNVCGRCGGMIVVIVLVVGLLVSVGFVLRWLRNRAMRASD